MDSTRDREVLKILQQAVKPTRVDFEIFQSGIELESDACAAENSMTSKMYPAQRLAGSNTNTAL